MSNHIKAPRLRRIVLAAAVALGIAMTPLVGTATPAEAAPVAGFNPGNIIDDSLFYNGTAMTAPEIQTFLNQRLANCKIGQPPYMPGAVSPSGSGNIIASACLKSFKQSTTSRPADAYCTGYVGVPNETSAQIIEKVGRACGISQKVLLVMLEKEQSLLTDDWPVTRQYNYALGMNCPDSGPGNSANCDAASAGFALQLYLGARQLKVYKGNPNSFNYKPFQNNTIQWHPNASCGTSQVYIENWATAALYIYTPYRPNQAALNAGWGTGDGCSSYGNRNFYNFYTSWFGSSAGVSVTGVILETWNRFGGLNGVLGAPKQTAQFVAANGGGYVQEFANGAIFYETSTGKSTAMSEGPFLANYRDAGYVSGPWAWPTGDANCNVQPSGCLMPFQKGRVAYSVATKVSQLVPTKLLAEWDRLGGVAGALGYPADAHVSGLGGDLAQRFAGGTLAWSNKGFAGQIAPAFLDYWNSINGLKTIGAPIAAPQQLTANGGGSSLEFTAGTVYTSPAGTFGMTHGPFRDGYLAAGGPAGSWGWPAGNAACGLINNGCYMGFQHGIGMWSAGTGMVLVSQESFDLWNRSKGSIGYPIRAPKLLSDNGGGEVQEFQLGTVWTSPAGTFGMTYGPFRDGYLAAGGPAGSWGWPAGNAACGLINNG
ncbi:hypothetical protein QBL02_09330, partial [Leucobacter sp. UT-8R-CII-1-4]|nr:hypothetical protein [Leucobacter sp. UT-8R-CII-1-4]